MKQKTEAKYQEWVKETQAKLPQELQQQFAALVGNPAGEEIFGGYMRESDYHRDKNALYEQEKQLSGFKAQLEAERQRMADDARKMQEWSDVHIPRAQAVHKQAERLAKQVETLTARLKEYGLDDDIPASVPHTEHTAADNQQLEALQRKLAQIDYNQPLILRDVLKVSRRAAKEGFDFDEDKLMEFSWKNGVDLMTAYERQTQEARTEKTQKDFEEKLAEARKEGERMALSRLSSPDRLRPAGPVAGDFAPPSQVIIDKHDRVNKAVEEFLALT